MGPMKDSDGNEHPGYIVTVELPGGGAARLVSKAIPGRNRMSEETVILSMAEDAYEMALEMER